MLTQTSPAAASEGGISLLQLSRELVTLDEIEVELLERPHEIRLRLLASEACQRLGALPEAADHLSAILITQPDHVEANRRLTRLLRELGDASGALRCWRRVLASTGEEDATVGLQHQELDHEGAPSAAFRGELGSFELLDLLEFLRVQEKTGSLVVSAPAGIGMLRLERGLVIGGTAPRLRSFGDVLLRRGLITRDQLESSRSPERDATSLAAALLRERHIEEGPLSDVLFRMTLHIISQIKQWQSGVFSFHPAPDTGFPIGFNVQQIALELARLDDERLR